MIPNFYAFNKAMEPYRQIMKNVEIVNKFALSEQLQLNIAIANMAKLHVDKYIQPIVDKFKWSENLGKRLKELFENIPSSLLLLAEYGWYVELDYGPTYYEYLGSLIKDGEIEELDKHLSDHYRKNIKDVFSSLYKRHPERAHLFKEIEIAHDNQLYSAAITLTLSQVDGISKDSFNRPFFLTENQLPKIKKDIEKVSASVIDLISSPLINKTPIMAVERELYNYPVQLNRHAIMHGSNKTYGIEINSLKCISFLKYFSDVLDHIER